jgi:hypothetical protein
MAGGGGNNQMLDMGLMIAAGIAAPELAPALMEGGALGIGGLTSGAAATGLAGAGLSAGVAGLTGQDVGKAALMGGLGGAAAGAFGGVQGAEPGSMLAAGPTTPGASLSTLPNIPPAGVQEAVQTGAQNVGTEAAKNAIALKPEYYDTVSPLGQLPATGSVSPAQLGGLNLPPEANTAYGQAYGDVYKNVLANSAPSTAAQTGLELSKAQMIGGGAAGINALLSAPQNYAYVPPGSTYTGGNLQKFKYDPATYQPDVVRPPSPLYRAQYAEGGITSLAMGGMPGQMYPQSQQEHTIFADPTQLPTSAMAVRNFEPATNPMTGDMTQAMASGGIAQLAVGGKLLKGHGDGMSDSIHANIDGRQQARLADGEFVIPADVVSHLGNGSTDAGAKHLYSMMDKVRKARTGNPKQGKQINPMKYLSA